MKRLDRCFVEWRVSPSVIAVTLLPALFVLVSAVACIGGSGARTGQLGVLGLYPDSTNSLVSIDVVTANSGEFRAASREELREERFWSEITIGLEDFGIYEDDVEVLSFDHTSGLMIFELAEATDFEDVADSLEDEGFSDDEYRGYPLWEDEDSSRGFALIETNNALVLGALDGVKKVLRSLARDEGLLMHQEEDPLVRSLTETVQGIVVMASRDCGREDFARRCDAAGASTSPVNDNQYESQMTMALVYRSTKAAEGALDELDDYLLDSWDDDDIDIIDYNIETDGDILLVHVTVDDEESEEAFLVAEQIVSIPFP